TDACFKPPSQMTTCDLLQGKYFSACALYRGDIDIKTIRDTIPKARTKYSVEFPEWVSGHFKVGHPTSTSLAEPSPHYHKSTVDLCMITQNTAISNIWKGLATKFDLMWSKHAFTHWYQSERPWREMLEAREELRLLELDYAEVAIDRSKGGAMILCDRLMRLIKFLR
ncbi:alpha-tubulin, partial [Flagelloscypha sp. PMI_526]